MNVSASVAVPAVAHTPSDQSRLTDKVTIRDLTSSTATLRALKIDQPAAL